MNALNGMIKQIAQETDGYKIGVPWKPTTASAVFIVPISKKTLIPRQYVTSPGGSQWLVVQDTGPISSVTVKNISGIIIFLAAGQILAGNTQPRCVATSIVIQPRETRTVNVFCIYASHGISNGAGMTIDVDVPRPLVQVLCDPRRNNQHDVWDEVTKITGDIGSEGVPRDDLKGNLDVDRKASQPFLSQIPEIPGQIGMAVFVGSGIYSLQIFDSPDSWSERRKAIIERELSVLNRSVDRSELDEGLKPSEIFSLLREFISHDFEYEEVEKGCGWQTMVVNAGSHSGEATILNDRVINFSLGLKPASILVENVATACVHDGGIKYGRGFVHADQVTKISLNLYESLASLKYFRRSNADLFLLRAAGYLHDIGVPPDLNHHINGFNLLKKYLVNLVPGTLSEADYRIILHCVLWHKDELWKKEKERMVTAHRLAAILRIADGLNYPAGRPTMRVRAFQERDVLVIEVCPSRHGDDLKLQIKKAMEKINLLEEVLKAKPSLGINKVEIRKCSHKECK